MYKIKYIKTKCGNVILFRNPLKHSDFQQFSPVSAGFVSVVIEQGKLTVTTYGESVSLNMKPAQDDEEVILATLRNLKYFKTEKGNMILFCVGLNHNDFTNLYSTFDGFEPASTGYVSIENVENTFNVRSYGGELKNDDCNHILALLKQCPVFLV